MVYVFRAPKGHGEEHFLAAFLTHLKHAEGGMLSKGQSLIHVRRVHIVMDTLDKNGDDIKCLAWKKGMQVWDKFCAPNLKNKTKTGNTIKTYLKSLEIFSLFNEKGDFYDCSILSEMEKAFLSQLQSRMATYRKSVHRRTAGEKCTREVEESFNAMTTEDLKSIKESGLKQKAVKLLGKSLEHHVLSRTEFTLVRDFLLVTMLYENGSRPGPLETAKVSRFEKAIYTSSQERWTMVVDEHKTTRRYGPAELVMDNQLYGYVKIYVQNIRPAYVHNGLEDALFIKEDGKPFEPGTIGKRVAEFFKKAGVREDIRCSSRKVRKIFAGAAFDLAPEKKRMMHRHMKHKEPTADHNYVLKLNAERAANTHRLMRKVYSKKQEVAEENKEEDPIHSSPQDAAADKQDEPARATSSSASGDENVVAKEGMEEKSPTKSPLPPSPTQTARYQLDNEEAFAGRGLTNDDKVVCACVFHKHISKGTSLSMYEFRDMPYLSSSVHNAKKVKQMYDFIRHKTKEHQHFRDIEDDPYDFDGVLTLPSTGS